MRRSLLMPQDILDITEKEIDVKAYSPKFTKKCKKTFKLIISNKKMAFGLIVLLLMVLMAIFANVIMPYDWEEMNLEDAFLKPSAEHLFGTDNYGRDIFSRIILGIRVSLGVSISSVVIALAIGLPLGLLAGYYEKFTDIVIMRFSDTIFAVPHIILAIMIASIIGAGINTVIISIAIAFIPSVIRIVRGVVFSVKGREYVAAANVLGISKTKIICKYILPNCLAPIIVHSLY